MKSPVSWNISWNISLIIHGSFEKELSAVAQQVANKIVLSKFNGDKMSTRITDLWQMVVLTLRGENKYKMSMQMSIQTCKCLQSFA